MSRLEARLQELENPDASTPSVRLHDPYAHFHETKRLSRSPPLLVTPESALSLAPLHHEQHLWHIAYALEVATEGAADGEVVGAQETLEGVVSDGDDLQRQ